MAARSQLESHSCLLLHFNIISGPSFGTHLENATIKTIWLVVAFSCYYAICLLRVQFYNQIGFTKNNQRWLRSFRTNHSVQLYVVSTLVELHEFPNVEDISKNDTS